MKLKNPLQRQSEKFLYNVGCLEGQPALENAFGNFFFFFVKLCAFFFGICIKELLTDLKKKLVFHSQVFI